MKKVNTLALLLLLCPVIGKSQLIVDLGKKVKSSQVVDPTGSPTQLSIINMCPNVNFSYRYEVNLEEETVPPFTQSAIQAGSCDSDDTNSNLLKIVKSLRQLKDETQVADLKNKLMDEISKLKGIDRKKYAACIELANNVIKQTEHSDKLQFLLRNNQKITIKVIRAFKTSDNKDSTVTWTQVFTTPSKSPWLVHYGLTYTPSAISKYDTYFAKDSSLAQTYKITKRNDNGPKPWENISATINFTYPFSQKDKPVDAGFTAGFGLSPGLQLSGHAGISAIIGKNIILGTGLVFMQKYKLNGQYKEGQIIKDNLAFDALHEKVWRPEFFFTIGFRFDKNPFAKTSSDGSTDSADDTAKKSNE